MRTIAVPLIIGAALTAGCGSQIGSEVAFGCLVDEEHEVTDLDALPEGFTLTAREARDKVIGTFEGTLTRVDDLEIDLALELSPNGPIRLQRRSWQNEGGYGEEPEPAIGIECEDAYAMPVQVMVAALPDLEEQGAVSVEVVASGRAAFHLSVDQEDMGGTAEPFADPTGADFVRLQFYGSRSEGDWEGEATFGIQVTHGDGTDGDDTAVSYTNDLYGYWEAGPPAAD